jgi:L-alanine-DL-glutamate epimerase-like enolase superfamily enzyme
MKITRIVCTPFTLPLRATIHFAAGSMPVTEQVLVEVHTDEGLIGMAEAPSRPFFYGESPASMIAAVEKWFGPALIGSDPFAIERAWHQFDRVEHNNTIKGALDIALHDVMGQALGISCRRLLGDWGDSVAVTYVCGLGAPQKVAEEAVGMHGRYGITAFKLKVGVDPAQDEVMLRHVRKALPDALLYIDGNQGLTAQQAIRLLDIAAEERIAWAEEPCSMHDRIGRQRIAAATAVPILGDESCRTLEEVAREVTDRTVHLVSIKTARTGFRLSRNILAYCVAARVRPMSGSQGDSGIGVIAGWHFCAAHRATQTLPAELSFFLNLADDLLAEPLTIRDGRLALPESPGLGVRIDRSKLVRYTAT